VAGVLGCFATLGEYKFRRWASTGNAEFSRIPRVVDIGREASHRFLSAFFSRQSVTAARSGRDSPSNVHRPAVRQNYSAGAGPQHWSRFSIIFRFGGNRKRRAAPREIAWIIPPIGSSIPAGFLKGDMPPSSTRAALAAIRTSSPDRRVSVLFATGPTPIPGRMLFQSQVDANNSLQNKARGAAALRGGTRDDHTNHPLQAKARSPKPLNCL